MTNVRIQLDREKRRKEVKEEKKEGGRIIMGMDGYGWVWVSPDGDEKGAGRLSE